MPLIQPPIGVFDSGVGGLSVLRALRAELPSEDFVYVADSGFAPYGERSEAFIVARARAITTHLVRQRQPAIKTLVVACNTATAVAIRLLRQNHPDLPIVGLEPALKPAAAISQTRRIGVMATRGTLASHKFQTLLASLSAQADFVCQPCDGLARAIEHDAAAEIERLCELYVAALGPLGPGTGQIDTLVLGCTHYPFAGAVLRRLVGPAVTLVDNGGPVARQTRRVLPALNPAAHAGQIVLASTGQPDNLAQAARRWLHLDSPVLPLTL